MSPNRIAQPLQYGEHGRPAEVAVEVLVVAGAFGASSRFWRLAENISRSER